MATTPLWVPLAVAGLAVVGTLAGVVFTQVWNSRLEERRWAREGERLREAQAREDANRTYEHRRAAYVDVLQEMKRLERLHVDERGEPLDFESLVDSAVYERFSALGIYGTEDAQRRADEYLHWLIEASAEPVDWPLLLNSPARQGIAYLDQVRKDLGIPERRKPAE